MNSFRSRHLLFCVVLLAGAAALAQTGPEIALTVDASQAPLKIIRTHMTMPAKPGPLTLYYPKWIPGMHEPAGPVGSVRTSGQVIGIRKMRSLRLPPPCVRRLAGSSAIEADLVGVVVVPPSNM